MRYKHLAGVASTMLATVTLLSAATAPPAYAEDRTVDRHYDLGALDSVRVYVECERTLDWALENRDYAPTRGVGRGISVTEDGGIGVTGTIQPLLGYRSVNHGFSGTATNWNPFSRGVTITAHCTNDPSRMWFLG
jgi:hypothetical protein